MKQIIHYLNYRDYLKDYYEVRKAKDPKFSHRMFCRLTGFTSPNFIKLVIIGKKNLSKKSIHKICTGLKFNRNEALYFEALVAFNQCSSHEKKKKLYEKLNFYKAFVDVKHVDEKYNKFLSNWYYPIIHQMTLLNHFREDPQWIVRQLGNQITTEQAKEAFELMQELGMLQKDKNNKLRPADHAISTDPKKIAPSIKKTHKELIAKGISSLDSTPKEFRDISSLTLAVNQNSFAKTKKLIQQFSRDLNVIMSNTKDVDAVYQLNIQFFNMSKIPWKESA